MPTRQHRHEATFFELTGEPDPKPHAKVKVVVLEVRSGPTRRYRSLSLPSNADVSDSILRDCAACPDARLFLRDSWISFSTTC